MRQLSYILWVFAEILLIFVNRVDNLMVHSTKNGDSNDT